MHRVSVAIQPFFSDVSIPSYQTSEAAGADIHAYLSEGGSITIEPLQRVAIPTGFSMAMPVGYEAQLRPRSGMAIKHGITLINSPGTIDSDYRGEVKILLVNLSDKNVVIHHGDRIAQMVIAPVIAGSFEVVTELANTQRGSGGFGSTGK